MTAGELARELATDVWDVLQRIEIAPLDVRRIRAEVGAARAEAYRAQQELADRLNREADDRHRQFERMRVDPSHPGTFRVERPPPTLKNEVH